MTKKKKPQDKYVHVEVSFHHQIVVRGWFEVDISESMHENGNNPSHI